MSDPRRHDWSGRLERLHRLREDLGLGALVLSHPVNLRYLVGFQATSGLLILAPGGDELLADGRYTAAVRAGLATGTLGPVGLQPVERRYDEALADVVARRGLARVGFEASHLTVAGLAAWQRRSPAVEWVPTEGLVEGLRAVKDAAEVAILRRAASTLSEVAGRLRDWVCEGRSEREVAASIDRALDRAGFSGPAFPTIVASGPNSALPHARPTDRRLVPGDLVVLDFGGVLDGYCVDLTRMAAVGQVSGRLLDLVDAVRDAHRAARRAVAAGVAASTVDAAARNVFEDRGLGPACLHATGHGLGLEVHEAPRIGRVAEDEDSHLSAGMVCTIEPGAYLEGIGGARLEDDVLVTAVGCEVLTTARRDLLVV